METGLKMTIIKNNPKLRSVKGNINGYAALAQILCTKIHDGEYAPGQRLDGARQIAEQFGVGRRVAVCALDLLAMKGLVRAEARRGYFVSESMRPGFSYTVGIYLCKIQPFSFGEELSIISRDLSYYGYELIYGCDMERGSSLKRFLSDNPKMDAIFLTGDINEADLKQLSNWKKPYLLVGAHRHLPGQPFEDAAFDRLIEEHLTQRLLPFRGKRFAAIVGDKNSISDRLVLAAAQRAAETAGCIIEPGSLVFTDGSGQSLVGRLLAQCKMDVIFSLGIFLVAIARIFQTEPDLVKPHVIGLDEVMYPAGVVPPDIDYLNLRVNCRIAHDSVTRMMEMLGERTVGQQIPNRN